MSSSTIYTVVMHRVHRIRILRMVLGGVGGSFLLLAGSLYIIGREVWVARVWENMPSIYDIAALVRFGESAFLSTQLGVQIALLVAGCAGIWLVQQVVQILRLFLQKPVHFNKSRTV